MLTNQCRELRTRAIQLRRQSESRQICARSERVCGLRGGGFICGRLSSEWARGQAGRRTGSPGKSLVGGLASDQAGCQANRSPDMPAGGCTGGWVGLHAGGKIGRQHEECAIVWVEQSGSLKHLGVTFIVTKKLPANVGVTRKIFLASNCIIGNTKYGIKYFS